MQKQLPSFNDAVNSFNTPRDPRKFTEIFEKYSTTILFDGKPIIVSYHENSSVGSLIIDKQSLYSLFRLKPEASELFNTKWSGSYLPLYSFVTLGQSLVKNGLSFEIQEYDYHTVFVHWAELISSSYNHSSKSTTLHFPSKETLKEACSFDDILTDKRCYVYTELIESIYLDSKTSTNSLEIFPKDPIAVRKAYTRSRKILYPITPVIFPINI